jgi:hypothetical protein
MALTDWITTDFFTKIKDTIKGIVIKEALAYFSKDAVKDYILAALNKLSDVASLSPTELDNLFIKIFKDGLSVDDNFEKVFDELARQLGFVLIPSGDGEEPTYILEN